LHHDRHSSKPRQRLRYFSCVGFTTGFEASFLPELLCLPLPILSNILKPLPILDGQIVAIDEETDEETLRRSYDKRSGKSAIHSINTTLRKGKETTEARYYILSKNLSGKKFAEAVRNHWRIENSLHWQLDVTFGEDQSRLRKGHADENFSTLRRTALSLLKRDRR